MIYGLPTDIDTVLESLQTKIATTDALIGLTRCIVTTSPPETVDDWPPSGDRWITISPQRFAVDTGATHGGGRDTLVFAGQVSVRIWNRYEVDSPLSDLQALGHATRGVTAFVKSVVSSLHLFSPIDVPSGKSILIEPMRLLSLEYVQKRPRSAWQRVDGVWSVKFRQSL